MARPRWIVPWADSETKRAIYHCVSRVVDKRFAFGGDDKEQFRTYMRMYENFSGCRVLSYCLMCNHVHLLLEVPPMPKEGLTDAELLKRLRSIHNEAQVAEVATELAEARKAVAEGRALDGEASVRKIHERYTYRMHDLSEFMKGLMQRFTQWHNRCHKRRGNLWEETFKSVVVEDGVASRTVAAYIDLNPVRAGMVADPAEYRWSSYGEAVGGGMKGNGKKARAGLVRALDFDGMLAGSAGDEVERWREVSRRYRRLMGLALGRKPGLADKQPGVAATGSQSAMNTMEMLEAKENGTVLPDLGMAKMLRCQVRYFTDGAVIGSRGFVDGFFNQCRDRFGSKRKNGARKLRGRAAADGGAAGLLWSARDLRRGIE